MDDFKADISKAANDLRLSVFAHYDKYIKSGRPFEENLLCLLNPTFPLNVDKPIRINIPKLWGHYFLLESKNDSISRVLDS